MSEPVIVDTHGITKEMEGKRLRITFTDGETAEIKMDWVMIWDCHEDCNGFIYYLLSTNREEKYKPPVRESAQWGKFQDIASFELVGD